MELAEAITQLFPGDDTLRFQVQAERAIPQEDVRLAVEVSALVATARPADETLEARIRSSLRRFIETDWTFSAVRRDDDAVGYERVTLDATARVPAHEIYNLDERARKAGEEGLSLKQPRADYSLSVQRMNQVAQELRLSLLENIKHQIRQFDEASGRNWRIGDIRFGALRPDAEGRGARWAARGQIVLHDVGHEERDEQGLVAAERIVLTADVTLRASPA